jgi:hypothetical protein
VGLGFETVWVVEDAGPAGVAPFRSPSEAGSRYVVAEMVAVICGKPPVFWARVTAFRVIRRPLTERRWLFATTNFWRRPRKSARWKKLPWKVKVNGSTGKPAGPIVAPGGSGVLGAVEDAPAVEEEDPLAPEDEDPLELEDDPPAGVGVGVLALAVPALKVRLWKSTFAALAALCSW